MAKSVLIVDDNAFMRQALGEIFQREADFEISGEAENGRKAIEKARQLHPDLIVLDLSMPVMNGLDAAPSLETFDAFSSADYVQRLRGPLCGAANPFDRSVRAHLKV